MRNPFRRHRETRVDGPQLVDDVFYGAESVAHARHSEFRSSDFPSWPGGFASAPSSDMDPEKALRLAPVYSAGRLLASSIASMPLQVYRRSGDERHRVATPALFDEPSQVGVLHDWLWRAMTSLVYRGNAVGMKTSEGVNGHPRHVEWLDPREIDVQDSRPSGRGSFTDPIWRYRGVEVSREHLVHIPWFTMPGKVWGLSPIGAYASSVSTAFAAQQYTSDWYENGGVPPGKFRNTSQTVDQKQADVIKDRLTSSIQSHQPIVYGSDWEYDTITIPAHEAKFVDTMRFTATQVATIYGIPAEMIGGDTGRSLTYSNTEQQAIEFVQFTLLPWLTKLESHFSAELLPRGQYVKFNADALIRTDATTRYNNYAIARNIGLLSINEIRAKEDLEPIAGGDTHLPLELQLVQAGKAVSSVRGSALEELDSADLAAELEALDEYGRAAPHGGSTLPIGPGHALWEYWTKGEGFAKWAHAVHKWTKLHHLLLEAGVPAHSAKGLTTNIIQATMPGYLKTNH